MSKYTENIQFRLFNMPCCHHLLCWVNPRLPNFCPECGKSVVLALREKKEATVVNDKQAWISFHEGGTPNGHQARTRNVGNATRPENSM